MRDLLALLTHLMATLARLFGPGGVKAVVAESLLLKHQLLIINRPRKRAPNLCASQRLLLGFWSLFLHPRRILRCAVILKPSTLLRFHAALKAYKYRWLYSRPQQSKPGPKGSALELIRAIVEIKQRNPRFGCPLIAQQLAKSFGLEIDKDVVRRVLATHYRPDRGVGGPSWLTLLGHAKDSLWSIDLFRVESVLLKGCASEVERIAGESPACAWRIDSSRVRKVLFSSPDVESLAYRLARVPCRQPVVANPVGFGTV